MSPQGFGFEPRKDDRRHERERRAPERRGSRERRLGDRRRRAKLVTVEQRLSGDRRARARRALGRRSGSRRKVNDRRSHESRRSAGLRITQQEFRIQPSAFEGPGPAPPSGN